MARTPEVVLKPTRAFERKSSRPPVLVINTYAGSLLLACRELGLDVIGSYEDVAFGTALQRANFPELEGLIASHREAWPETLDLEEAVVVAHPPCAGFSNLSAFKKDNHGVDSTHFRQTVDVARYALGKKCAALLVESVVGALEGGRETHDALAEENGYHLFRLLQNATTFGLPQWRPRFWAIYVRRDLLARLPLVPAPRYVTVGDFFTFPPGEPDARFEDRLAQQIVLLSRKGMTDAQIHKVLNTPGLLATNIKNELRDPRPTHLVLKDYCLTSSGRGGDVRARFLVDSMRILPPDEFGSVVLETGWFVFRGKSLTPAQYRAYMGFPADYVLDHRTYLKWLSKGVCVPVASWLLDQVIGAVEKRELPIRDVTWIEPGDTCDISVPRAVAAARARGEEDPKPGTTRRSSAPRMRAVAAEGGGAERAFILEAEQPLSPGDVLGAFVSTRVLVLPPVRDLEVEGQTARGVVQYRSPNGGGHGGDLRGLLERAVRRLNELGRGPVRWQWVKEQEGGTEE